MARRKSAAAVRADKAKRAGIAKIAGVALVVIAMGGAYGIVAAGKRDLDVVTLCPAERSSITVLLVDVTDPMNVAQRQDFLNQLERLKNSIPRYGQLSVMKVDAAGDRLLAPIITRCNPGTAADANDTTGNPAALQKQHDEGFDQPLRAAFETLTRATGADTSPIMESIQSVALTEFQQPAADGAKHRLIVASDLLQNTKSLSFYDGLPAADDLVGSAAFRTARTDLRDVDVELWMLERLDGADTQPRALADLWEQIITEQGGNLTRTYKVSG